MELIFVIAGLLFAFTLAYKLVKGAIGLVIKLAIIGTGLWALYYFKPDIFG
jgi:divalent metal cation (Fe/Co/Zn/Cd) transporter